MDIEKRLHDLRLESDAIAVGLSTAEQDAFWEKILAEALTRALVQTEEMFLAQEDMEKLLAVQEAEGSEAAVLWLASTVQELPRLLDLHIKTHLEEIKAGLSNLSEDGSIPQ